jgi:hypothetical protein
MDPSECGHLGDANTEHASLFGRNSTTKAPRQRLVRNVRGVF